MRKYCLSNTKYKRKLINFYNTYFITNSINFEHGTISLQNIHWNILWLKFVGNFFYRRFAVIIFMHKNINKQLKKKLWDRLYANFFCQKIFFYFTYKYSYSDIYKRYIFCLLNYIVCCVLLWPLKLVIKKAEITNDYVRVSRLLVESFEWLALLLAALSWQFFWFIFCFINCKFLFSFNSVFLRFAG